MCLAVAARSSVTNCGWLSFTGFSHACDGLAHAEISSAMMESGLKLCLLLANPYMTMRDGEFQALSTSCHGAKLGDQQQRG